MRDATHPRRSLMKLTSSMVAVGTCLLLTVPIARARGTDRLTDKEVSNLIEQVYEARDKFEGRLEGKVKNGVVRSSTGEVHVHSMLEDFQHDVDNLNAGPTGNNPAPAEVQPRLVPRN